MEPSILIFKTNINCEEAIARVAPVLATEAISQWNIDHTDIDCVLRVVTASLTIDDIITLLTKEGYYCSELTT